MGDRPATMSEAHRRSLQRTPFNCGRPVTRHLRHQRGRRGDRKHMMHPHMAHVAALDSSKTGSRCTNSRHLRNAILHHDATILCSDRVVLCELCFCTANAPRRHLLLPGKQFPRSGSL